jgi:hypothetical protein
MPGEGGRHLFRRNQIGYETPDVDVHIGGLEFDGGAPRREADVTHLRRANFGKFLDFSARPKQGDSVLENNLNAVLLADVTDGLRVQTIGATSAPRPYGAAERMAACPRQQWSAPAGASARQ